jgi:hypothetical protein
MPCLPEKPTESEVWTAIGPDFLLEMLAPLRDEHLRRGAAALVSGDPSDIERVAVGLGNRRGTLLVVEDPARPSARAGHSSPVFERSGSPNVVVGWVRLDRSHLSSYARRAAALLRRRDDTCQPAVLLAPRDRRYLDLLDEIERTTRSSPSLTTLRWSGERIRRGPLLAALRLGTAAVLYTGHGHPGGWFAYGGLSIDTLVAGGAWSTDHVNSILFSLACHTGQPSMDRISDSAEPRPGFADGVIAHGVAGAVLAPLGDPLHADNRVLAHALFATLARGERRLSDIVHQVKSAGASLHGYAVIGDPAVLAIGAPGAMQRAERVFAPAADADLTPKSSFC